MLTKEENMIGTVYNNEQDLLQAILDIHCPQGIEVDPMYFKGNFYKAITPPRYKYDIQPIILGVEQADAKDLPLGSRSVGSIILDPPFMFGIHGKTEKYYSSATHGIFPNFGALAELYQGILKEAWRVLINKGICIIKCQDYTDSKTTMTHCFVWQWAVETGLYPKDLAILHLPKGKVYNSNLTQRHLRKTHSYFWVFRAMK